MTLKEDLENVWDAIRVAREARDRCCSAHREELLSSAATVRDRLSEVDKSLNEAVWATVEAIDAA